MQTGTIRSCCISCPRVVSDRQDGAETADALQNLYPALKLSIKSAAKENPNQLSPKRAYDSL